MQVNPQEYERTRGDLAEATRRVSAQASRIAALEAENKRLREALAPSGSTKVAYWGSDDHEITDWRGIKTIMRLIRERAGIEILKEQES